MLGELASKERFYQVQTEQGCPDLIRNLIFLFLINFIFLDRIPPPLAGLKLLILLPQFLKCIQACAYTPGSF